MITALLQDWIIDDGEMAVPAVGERVTVGLGLAVEAPPRVASDAELDGIVLVGSPVPARRSAEAVVTGPVRVVWDHGPGPFAWLMQPCPGIQLLVMGIEPPPTLTDGARLSTTGLIVVEPYLWGEGGLLRRQPHIGPTSATVLAIRELDADIVPPDGRARDVLLELDPTST